MLTTADLAEPRLERGRENHKTYKQILGQCYRAVEDANRRRLFFVRFMIPMHLPARPTFNPSHALLYVTGKLRRGGFLVTPVPPTGLLLHVEWAHARPSQLPKQPGEPRCRGSSDARQSLLDLLGKR